MAYQAKRRNLYTEEFQLTEEDGTVVHTLHVALDADSMAKKLSENHTALVKALNAVKHMDLSAEPGEKLELLENAVMDMIKAVFGENDAATVIEFYGGRYVEMCREVIPFITAVVIPQIRRIAQEDRRRIAAGYVRKKKWK